MRANSENSLTPTFLIGIGCILLVVNIYYFCYEFFAIHNLNNIYIDRFVFPVLVKLDLFDNSYIAKIYAYFPIVVSILISDVKKKEDISLITASIQVIIGTFLYFAVNRILISSYSITTVFLMYTIGTIASLLFLIYAFSKFAKYFSSKLMKDVWNEENESFLQEDRLMENQYSINLETEYTYKGEKKKGYINVVNPFRASLVLGTPGSGKSYSIINQYIQVACEKGYSMYVYDFKYPDLSKIVYSNLMKNIDSYPVKPKFYQINFDDPTRSHRCNPLNPILLEDISDAYEASYVTMLNLNRTWIKKQGDFFVESPIILFAAIIWFLKIYENGKYCSFPHAIEFLNLSYKSIFGILSMYDELENYIAPFVDAWQGGAQDQLQGQLASAKIPLSRMISPQLYWVMTGDDFTLDLNDPQDPKILCTANNPDRQNIYSTALSLYNARILKLMNKPKKLHSMVIIDELPTLYFKGLDNLIATARSNKVAVCLSCQDISQLNRDYGDKEAKVIFNTIGNVFSGQVVGESAKTLSERFGKVLQKRQSLSINSRELSTSISTQMDNLIPTSKISNLSQGMFVGAVQDNINEQITQKIFHAEIKVEPQAELIDIPEFIDFGSQKKMREAIRANYIKIKEDIKDIEAYFIK